MSEEKVLVGVIGGSGLYHLDNLTFIPGDSPASPITIASLPSGARVAFLARHGRGHSVSPSTVPNRANIAALKSLGVRAVLAFTAVGSLREEIAPGDFALPSQALDRTKGVRAASFFEGTSVVAHTAFGDPFSPKLSAWVEPRLRAALEGRAKLHTETCVVCIEGPQFSTRAESVLYRTWGGDLINMSAIPESKLAREAEISYALIATATDYDSWRPEAAAVTAHDVFQTLKQNADTSRHVAAALLDDLQAAVAAEDANVFLEHVGSMKFSIMPRSTHQLPADRVKLAYVLPEYFSGEEQHDIGTA